MSQPASTDQQDYQEFLAWKEMKNANKAQEPPVPSIAEVLKAMVNLLPVANQVTQQLWHKAIDEWHAATGKVSTPNE